MQFRQRYAVFALLFVAFDMEMVFIFPWAVVCRQRGLVAIFEPGVLRPISGPSMIAFTRDEKHVFEAIFRVAVQVETDEQGQRVFPVTKHRTPVNEAEFLSLLASVYQEEVYPRLKTDDTLTITVHLDLPLREVERTFHFRDGRLFEGEGCQQPMISDPLPLVQGVYEKFVQQVGPGEIFTLTFHVEQP